MDLEAMQLLNLSPIPELSEIELSTMLDHLSGLSDINGDLTDRNVEDIIKEAEDLLDKSTSSKMNEPKDVNIRTKAEGNKLHEISQENIASKESEEYRIQESDSNETKHNHNPVNDVTSPHNTSIEDDSKHFNTPVESTPPKVYSPGSTSTTTTTTNHIKSTIDSLKEFSTLVEKKLGSQSQNSSPKGNKKTKQNAFENKQVTVTDCLPNEKFVSTKQTYNSLKTFKPSDLTSKKTESCDKSIKLLNCFERLYQVRPVRLCATKRPKVVELVKAPKIVTKKKLNKDIKNVKKTNRQGKTILERSVDEDAKNLKMSHHSSTFIVEDESLMADEASLKYFLSGSHQISHMPTNKSKPVDEHLTQYHLENDFERNNFRQIQSRIDEKLILKVLEEMEEIKDQVKKVGAVPDYPRKKMKDDVNVVQAKMDPLDGKYLSESEKNSGIMRLELQFSLLKEKYDYQMEKLEAENSRLREALNNQDKFFLSQINMDKNEILRSPSSEKKASTCVSSENCKAPKNSPCSSLENMHTEGPTMREAFSQTEEEPKSGRREVGTDAAEIFPEVRKTENKENVAGRKKLAGKCKPFSDVSQSMRQKKIVEHESQLLATLRGLQVEITAKDKENRKLKNEMEAMRKQMKKVTICKEGWKRCHAGTQTIGLRPFMQKPYNPENYEVPQEFERENEDLRSRIKALEEDFELLKEKRITDLQALHQVHEEEMAKLVSKLETQSALTRHLHSLLVNR